MVDHLKVKRPIAAWVPKKNMPLVIAPPPEPARDPEPTTVRNRAVTIRQEVEGTSTLVMYVMPMSWAVLEPADRASSSPDVDGTEAVLPEIDHARWAATVRTARDLDEVDAPAMSPFGDAV